jgi:hypothetical protein
LTSTQVDANFIALNDELATKAPIDSPVFTTEAKAPTFATVLSYTNPSTITDDPTFPIGDTHIVTREYLQNALGSISQHILPAQDAYDTGTTDTTTENTIFKGVNLGSEAKRFANIHVASGKFAATTIELGTASLSGSAEGGVILPTNTAIGEASNVIPPNIASSVLDSAFAETGNAATLSLNFTFEGSGGSFPPYPLTLKSNGKVDILTSGSGTDSFIGFATDALVDGQEASVVISGQVTGFSAGTLTNGSEMFIGPNGALTSISSATNVKIGKAISATTLFLYTTSTIDTYVTTVKKLELTDLSVGANQTPTGEGGIAYDNTTGVFSFTPTKDIENAGLTGTPTAPTASVGTSSTQIATTEFVAAEVAALVGAAPATLDTLDEIAAAIADDGNFATTVAPKASPALTGIPTAPTAASGTNSTQIATTEFVASGLASVATLNNAALTGTPTAPTAAAGTNTTQLATTEYADRAVAQGGGGVNIDGGLANSIRNTTTIALDGGNA